MTSIYGGYIRVSINVGICSIPKWYNTAGLVHGKSKNQIDDLGVTPF
jgi:hypothetical protein